MSESLDMNDGYKYTCNFFLETGSGLIATNERAINLIFQYVLFLTAFCISFIFSLVLSLIEGNLYGLPDNSVFFSSELIELIIAEKISPFYFPVLLIPKRFSVIDV